MRALRRLRAVEVLTGITEGTYDIDYVYDAQGRVEQEVVSGAINRTTTYTYDADDSISTEVTQENGRTITKAYTYDPVTKNITKVQVTVA
jgi:YD repeat-containing protein